MVNPFAGRGRAAAAGREVAAALRGRGHDVRVYDRPGLDRTTAEVSAALRGDDGGVPDVLVAVGGDGAVNLAVNLLEGTPVPLGVVPAGTGNDIARSFGLPLDHVAAVETIDACLRSGTAWAVDTVAIGGGADPAPAGTAAANGGTTRPPADLTRTRPVFAGVMATGFDAAVSERANRWRWPTGPARYNLAILRELPLYQPRRYRLRLDGEVWEVDALLVSIANTASYGGGMRIAPAASVVDGLVDVVVVRPLSKARFVRLYPRVYKGTHVDVPVVEVRRAAALSVEVVDGRAPVVAYADGERIAPLPLHLAVRRGSLRVLARPAAQGA